METNSARIKAASEGRNRFEGKPCGVCGATERYTINGACCACHNKRSAGRQRRFRNKLRDLLKDAKGGQQ